MRQFRLKVRASAGRWWRQLLRLGGALPVLGGPATGALGRSLLDHGRVDDARLAAQAQVGRRADSVDAWWLLARCANAAGDRAEEERCLRQVLLVEPEHRLAEAALLAIKAWRHRPVMDAWHRFHGGRYADSIVAFDAALEAVGTRVAPTSVAEAWTGKAWCWYSLQSYEYARQCFVVALGVDPGYVQARKGLGMTLYRLGAYDAAESELAAAIAAEPVLADARAFIGWCRLARQDAPGARAAFEEARRCNPLVADAWFGVAWSSHALQEVVQAGLAFVAAAARDAYHPSLRAVIRLALDDPHYADLRLPLGRVLLAANRPDLAAMVLEAARNDATCFEAESGAALALFYGGRATEAAQRLAVLDPATLDRVFDEPLFVLGARRPSPCRSTLRILQARCAMVAADHALAERILHDLATEPDTPALALVCLAEIAIAQGRLAAAGEFYDRAAIDPALFEPIRLGRDVIHAARRAALADAYAACVADPAQGLSVCQALVGDDDEFRLRRSLLVAQTALRGGRPDVAQSAAAEALRIEAGNLHAILTGARALAAQGKLAEAARLLKDTLNRNPDALDVLNEAARIAGLRGRPVESRRWSRRIRRHCPLRPRSRDQNLA